MRVEIGKYYLYRVRSIRPVFKSVWSQKQGQMMPYQVGRMNCHTWVYGESNGNVATAPTLWGMIRRLLTIRKSNGYRKTAGT